MVTRNILATVIVVVIASVAAADDDPWIITEAVVVTEPVELGNVILLDGGSLTIRDVPEPGVRISGHIWATGDSAVRFEGSDIRFMSVYHGQYSLVAAGTARVEVIGCDYRVPNGVQHALFAVEESEFVIEDTDFGDVQLISGHTATIDARRLDGNFEVIVQDDSTMRLADIPRTPENGSIWVWVEFPSGSVAEYTPPLPGFVESWSFPPPGATGIEQSATVDRCETLLWPMLVRADSDVTLRDIPEEHWVVVGFHLPDDLVVDGLVNDQWYEDHTLALDDRVFRVVDASIDTWNLYPQADARVTVRDSQLGEILSLENSRVRMERTTIDGTGGFFGARDTSRITAVDCLFTCTIEATQESTITLYSSRADPYPLDPTGQWTRFGAYDDGRLFASQTAVETTPALAGRGLIAVSYLHDPPTSPPGPEGVALTGSIAQFSLDPEVAAGSWRLEASARDGRPPAVIGSGDENVEDGLLGVWSDADPSVDHRLQSVLTDGLGRTLVGNLVVPGSGSRVR
jgi:hypothetical protein